MLVFVPLLLLSSTVWGQVEPFPPTVEPDLAPTGPPIPITPRPPNEKDELLFVQAVWRHGDRAPTMTFPTDQHQEEAWPNGWGELTQLGMRQQYALGRLIRARYMNESRPFLNPCYNAKEIYIRSTDVNRTLISAYANIAGMFSSGHAGKDFPDYVRWPTGWTPVPVHTIDLEQDYAGNVFAPCPRALELDEELRQSQEYLSVVKENQDFLNFISNKTGMKVELPILYLINDVTHIEAIYNMSLPDWITPEITQQMRNLTQIANEYTYGISKPYFPELIRLRGGNMLKFLIDNMKFKLFCRNQKSPGPECNWMRPLKYYAYSAHDTTIAALLTTFGDEERVIRGGLPKYTASVVIELWKLHDVGYAVKILFHGAFHHNYHTITHLTKGCPENSEFCPLKTFEKRSQKFMPLDLAKECQAKKHLTDNRTGSNCVFGCHRFS